MYDAGLILCDETEIHTVVRVRGCLAVRRFCCLLDLAYVAEGIADGKFLINFTKLN